MPPVGVVTADEVASMSPGDVGSTMQPLRTSSPNAAMPGGECLSMMQLQRLWLPRFEAVAGPFDPATRTVRTDQDVGFQPSLMISKSLASRLWNAGFRTLLFQRESMVPCTYMFPPRSATINPYVFIAWKMRRISGG